VGGETHRVGHHEGGQEHAAKVEAGCQPEFGPAQGACSGQMAL
jgi:hypothetical protein